MLTAYPEGSNTRFNLLTELTFKGLVPQSRGNIYKLLAMHANGTLNLNEDWKRRGQLKRLAATDVSEVAADLESHGVKSVGEDELILYIHNNNKKRIEENSCVPLTAAVYEPSITTLNNYKALVVASHNNISTSNTAVSKSNTWFTSESSLISAMALLLITAATHYMITE